MSSTRPPTVGCGRPSRMAGRRPRGSGIKGAVRPGVAAKVPPKYPFQSTRLRETFTSARGRASRRADTPKPGLKTYQIKLGGLRPTGFTGFSSNQYVLGVKAKNLFHACELAADALDCDRGEIIVHRLDDLDPQPKVEPNRCPGRECPSPGWSASRGAQPDPHG